MKHLGGFSPRLLYPYFMGYEHALSFHEKGQLSGDLSLYQFSRWFTEHAYGGPQGFASFCLLLTDTDEDGLKLFFEFRKLSKKDLASLESSPALSLDMKISILEFLKMDAIRERPAMYFGNGEWLTQMWAMCNGYVDAEQDIGAKNSPDAQKLKAFEIWLWDRFPFAEGKNWGKLFQFLALEVNSNALELFFDNLDLFLDGASPKDNSKRFQQFLDDAVASVLENQKAKASD